MECKNANNFIVWSFNRKYKMYEEEFHTFAGLLRQAQISKRSGYFCREKYQTTENIESRESVIYCHLILMRDLETS